MITISNVYKSFGKNSVLSGVGMTIEEGSLVAVVGPSGTGKSVLLKLITGMLEVDSGTISIDGHVVTGHGELASQTPNSIVTRFCENTHLGVLNSVFRKNVQPRTWGFSRIPNNKAEREMVAQEMGVLFQAAALFDSMTLFENVSFPLEQRRKLSSKEIQERSLQYLHDVGLKGYEDKLPGEISIGMRKRVGIARALITEPKYLFFDEPNTGLDPEMGQGIYELIIKMHARYGFTGIVISHEIPEIFQVCQRVIMLYNGQVQIDGTVEEFLACNNPVVRQFIKGAAEGPIQLNF